MKKLYIKFKAHVLLIILLVTVIGCEYQETDFGNNGSIRGEAKDNLGNTVYSDVLTNNIVVKLLGEGDQLAIDVRVKGDGTYQNTKIFPKEHKIWVSGPVVFTDTIYHDFSVTAHLEKDFEVIPYMSPEIISATVVGTSVDVEYAIVENAGKTVSNSEIYCSTAQYPTASIGTFPGVYSTITVSLSTSLSGTENIPGLTSGQKYYIRIGSLANGTSLMNYSNQMVVTIP